jgi:hypothetical protein
MAFVAEQEVRDRHGFAAEQTLLGSVIAATAPGTNIKLDSKAYAISELIKNGVALATPADYTFSGPSKNITLVVAAVAADEFVVEYHTELKKALMDQLISHATATVRSFLERKYTASVLDAWESPGPAPDLIIGITAELAGIKAEMAMLRKGHTFNPDSMTALNKREEAVMKQLKAIDLGKIVVPGVAGADDVLVGRLGAGHVFAHEQDISRVGHQRLDRRLGTDGRVLQPELAKRKLDVKESEGPIFD